MTGRLAGQPISYCRLAFGHASQALLELPQLFLLSMQVLDLVPEGGPDQESMWLDCSIRLLTGGKEQRQAGNRLVSFTRWRYRRI